MFVHSKPDKSEELGGVYRYIKRIDYKVVVAIYRHKGNKIIVMTAYQYSRLYRYLD